MGSILLIGAIFVGGLAMFTSQPGNTTVDPVEPSRGSLLLTTGISLVAVILVVVGSLI